MLGIVWMKLMKIVSSSVNSVLNCAMRQRTSGNIGARWKWLWKKA